MPELPIFENGNYLYATELNQIRNYIKGSISNPDIANNAAIAYSKLDLLGSIVNADISDTAAIAYSKLNLALSIVNADIAAEAAIAYSKLALKLSIKNTDIATDAAIAESKIAFSTSGHAHTGGTGGSKLVFGSCFSDPVHTHATDAQGGSLDSRYLRSNADDQMNGSLTVTGDIYCGNHIDAAGNFRLNSNQYLLFDSGNSKGMRYNSANNRFELHSGTPLLAASIRPYSDHAADLGSASFAYNNVYAAAFIVTSEYPDEKTDAIKEISKIKTKNIKGKTEYDYDSLPECVKSDNDDNDSKRKGGKDISMSVGLLELAIKQIVGRLEKIEKKLN